jgi:hypothetical protein
MATFEESFLHPLYLLLVGSGVLGVAVALLTYILEGRRKKQQNDLEDRRQKQQNDLEDLRKDREIEVDRKRKELEIKVDIVSKILEVYGSAAAKPFLSRMRGKPISNIDEVLEKFCVGAYIVDSMLDSYYSSKPDILDRWGDFFFSYVAFLDATSLYIVKDRTDRTEDKKNSLDGDLNKIKKYLKKYFSDNKEIDLYRLTAGKDYDPELWGKIDGLTAGKDYDPELWGKIDDLYWHLVTKIYKDVLKHDIKVF